jgi:hypothetical protein
MAIAIDASTPVRFAGTPANGVNITSASFTAPADAVLVLCISGDSAVAVTLAASDSGGLTWTQEVLSQPASNHGYSAVFTAVTVSAVARTVSCLHNGVTGASSNRISAKCYVVTGADTTDPVGQTGAGESTTNNWSPALYTSSVDNSRAIYVGTDWAQLGVPGSTDTEDGADYSGQVSVMSAYKAADTPTSGTGVTGNLDAGGAGTADWSMAAVEIKPAAGVAPGPAPVVPAGDAAGILAVWETLGILGGGA